MSLQDSVRASYWETETFLRNSDIAIIGGGITGLNASIALKSKRPELDVVVIERGPFSTGASTRNAGFACFGSPSEILADAESMGMDRAIELVLKRKAGLEYLFSLIDPASIDYTPCGGAEVFFERDAEIAQKCHDIVPVLNRELKGAWDVPPFAESLKGTQVRLPPVCKDFIALPREGHLHPGKLIHELNALATRLGVRFLNGFEITHFEETGTAVNIFSGQRMLSSRMVGVATNGFASKLLGDVEVVPARNQVYLSKPFKEAPVTGCVHYNQGYVYFRDVKNRLLIGGARDTMYVEESTDEFGITDGIEEWLSRFVHADLDLGPVPFEYQWSGILGVGSAKSPIIQMTNTRIGVGVRLGGMGVALGSNVGKSMAEMLLQRF